jgi:hypothetical protein
MNKLLTLFIYFAIASAGIGAWKANEFYSDGILTPQELTQSIFHGVSWGSGIAFILHLREY